MKRTWLLPCLILLLLAPLAHAQRTFEGATDVVLIEVPVTVTSDGDPIRGLTKANFELRDEGKKQDILSVEMVDLFDPGSPDAPPPAIPAPARRHFLFLFDLGFSNPENVVQARSAANVILDDMHPSDLIGVALYTPTRGAMMVLNFTSDRNQVRVALESLGVPQLLERNPDPLGLVIGELSQAQDIGADSGGGLGQAADARSDADAEILQRLASISDFARVEQRNRIKAMSRSMSDFARALAPIEGQKQVFFLSEGFDGTLLTGDGATDLESRLAAESGNLWEVSTETRYGDTRLQNEFEEMIEALRRAGATMQVVDIGGIAQGGQGFKASDGLVALAKDTGGNLYENFNALDAAMTDILARTSVTYIVSFQPKNLKIDGEYHKLKIKLVDAPRGARLSHRSGYYAPTKFDEVIGIERQVTTAGLVLADEDRGTIDSSVLAAPFPMSNEKAYVPVLIEVDGPSLIADQSSGSIPLELFVYALDEKGAVHDFLSQNLVLRMEDHGAALRQRGLKYWGHVDLDPGSYRVQVMVRNSVTGRFSTRRAAVTVPEFATGESALLPPFFPEQPGIWLLTRETEERQRPGAPYPFMAGEQPFIPSVRPRVAGNGETPLYLQAYNVGSGSLIVDAKLMDPSGESVGDRAKIDVTDSSPAQGGKRTVEALLETDDLDPGIYQLEITLSEAGGTPHTTTLSVEVVEGRVNARWLDRPWWEPRNDPEPIRSGTFHRLDPRNYC
ncbi:MAG: VWA domain-containing protein [Acidobacteriota bacterium]